MDHSSVANIIEKTDENIAIGMFEKAIENCEAYLVLNPESIEVHYKLGVLYLHVGDFQKSNKCFFDVIRLDPDNLNSNYFIGHNFKSLWLNDLALRFYKKAYKIASRSSIAFSIAKIHLLNKRKDLALEWLTKSIQLNPNHYEAKYYTFFHKVNVCDWTNRKQEEKEISDILNEHLVSDKYNYVIPKLDFNYLYLDMVIHLKLNQYHYYNLKKNIEFIHNQHKIRHEIGERPILNIGYISPDLIEEHPVGRCIADLFQYHSRDQVKIHVYSVLPLNTEDRVTQKIQNGSDVIRELCYKNHIEAAKQIHEDKIDILVDLAGHTSYNQWLILFQQPAPVQIHWLGYPGTTGMTCIQYLLGDRYLIPKSSIRYYSEKVWHLPSAFISSQSEYFSDDSNQTKSREDFGLPENAFVFVNFGRSAKVEPELFDSWLHILQKVHNSVLWLSHYEEETQGNLLSYAQTHDICTDRIIFASHLPHDEYLMQYQIADLFLDTWHYSAGSTAMAALSQGVPVLTVIDESNASRMGASIVAAAGIPELICNNLKEYQDKAIELATNHKILQSFSEYLRKSVSDSALFNNQNFAKQLERAFRQIWSLEIQDSK